MIAFMARPLRIEFPGAWYHVMNRGRRSEAIFSDKDNYSGFLDLLVEISEIWNATIAAYCLMSTISIIVKVSLSSHSIIQKDPQSRIKKKRSM